MTRIYKEGNNALDKIEIEKVDSSTIIEERTWIEVTDPTQESLEAISKKTNIPLHFLMSSLDEEESARIDNENGSVLIVLDVPCLSSPNSDSYITQPFIIAYNEKYYVTINRFSETLLPNLFKNNQRSSLEPHKPVRLSLNIIYQMSKEFIYYLRKIDAHTKDIELRLHTSMKNKELFELLDINKTLVYSAAAAQNERHRVDKPRIHADLTHIHCRADAERREEVDGRDDDAAGHDGLRDLLFRVAHVVCVRAHDLKAEEVEDDDGDIREAV